MTMRSGLCKLGIFAMALSSIAGFAVHAQGVPEGNAASDLAGDLHWRLLGPFRAGWSTMVKGIADQPDVYYFGAAGGGVWKTADAGQTWHSLGDQLPAASIGALAIAPSDPKIIYIGTGQVAARYDVAAGNGVYKSTDGGVTWASIGLAATRHVGAILIDPRQPDTLLVGALGHYFGPNPERGVYRSADGGKTWQQTLFIDANTGVVDLAADAENPDIVYAAAWQVRNYPWLSYFQPNAGPGSGVYKSTDGGVSWKHLTGHGWPTATLGRIGLATASGGRIYAVVHAQKSGGDEADESGSASGLYRSDDSGATWQHVSQEGWLGNDYFSRIAVDPGNHDRIYATGQSIRRSDDAGEHWTVFKGAPGGDDYHFVWINPKHPDHIATASDQGTVVTVDGGQTWSDWYNQPTAQLYHLAADNRFPYWVYSGQQDSGTVGIASRSDYGSLSFRDWHPVGGDERDYDLPDPQDPEIVYGSGLGGRLSRWDGRTGEVQNISPWPQSSYGARPTTVKYRYTWITPIAVSQKPPFPLYQGAQVLFRSTDQGRNWATISPDLSAKAAHAKNCAGNPSPADARDCGFGVIFSIGLSPRDNDEIWIGTDDGLIQLTRDGGGHWENVTPRQVPHWAKVASIDVSATEPGTAYAAIDNHRQDDFRPRALRTHDYGKTWVEIDNGFPANGFVNVVRADPVKSGLLYAGSDSGVYFSIDDGAHWQSLQRNLPTAWVRDLLVHGDDLIVATQGRAIWVLDDVSPLRQSGQLSATEATLFQPAPAMRVRGSQNKDTPPPADTALGQNPATGATIDYRLVHNAQKVTLQIRDSTGRTVRQFASDVPEPSPAAERYFSKSWTEQPASLAVSAGMHRFVWDLRLPRPRAVHYDYSIGAVFGEGTPIAPQGMLVPPGDYEILLDVDGRQSQAPLKIVADPRAVPEAASLHDAIALFTDIQAALERDYIGYGELDAVDAQIAKVRKDKPGKPLLAAVAKFQAASESLRSGENDSSESFDAIGEALSSLGTDIEGSDRAPTRPQHELLAALHARLDRGSARWESVKRSELPQLNAQLKAASLTQITVPAADQIRLDRVPESVDLP